MLGHRHALSTWNLVRSTGRPVRSGVETSRDEGGTGLGVKAFTAKSVPLKRKRNAGSIWGTPEIFLCYMIYKQFPRFDPYSTHFQRKAHRCLALCAVLKATLSWSAPGVEPEETSDAPFRIHITDLHRKQTLIHIRRNQTHITEFRMQSLRVQDPPNRSDDLWFVPGNDHSQEARTHLQTHPKRRYLDLDPNYGEVYFYIWATIDPRIGSCSNQANKK